MVFIRKALLLMLTHKSRSVRGAAHEPKAAQWTCKSSPIPSQGFGFVTLIISHVFPSLILSYYTLNRIAVASKVLNLLNRRSFLQSPAVKCGHRGDFDAFSMFAAEDSLCDLRSLSGLNPGPPSPCLPLSKIQNLGCENHLDVRGNPSPDWQENGLE